MGKKYRRKDRIQWSQRKMKQMLIITAILIVPPFILWGISTAIRSNREFVVGKVGKWTITRPMWNREFSHTQIDYMLRQRNKDIPSDLLTAFTWNRIISLYIAQKNRVKVSDKDLAKWIRSLPIFQDKNGNFSIQRYQQVIRSLGIPEKAFEETIRENLMIERLKDIVTQNISISDKELSKAWRDKKERFKIRLYPIWINKVMPQVHISEDEIREYYEKHKGDLIVPETVNLEYLIIPQDKYTTSLQNKSFEQISKELQIEPKRKDKLKADQILPDIGLSQEFYSYAFSLPQGKSSPIFQLQNGGYCILKIKSKTTKHIGDLDEVKETIKSKLEQKKAMEQAMAMAEDLIKHPEKIKDWEEIQEFSARTPYIPLVGKADKLIEKLREAIKENRSMTILNGPKGVFVIEIVKHRPAPNTIPEEEKQKIKEELLNMKKLKVFQEFMLKQINNLKIIRKDNK